MRTPDFVPALSGLVRQTPWAAAVGLALACSTSTSVSGGEDETGGGGSGPGVTGGADSSGGEDTGGGSSGGDATGGGSSGGDSSGGDSSGGDASGGDASGGDASGGDASGGDASGGAPPDCDPPEVACGSECVDWATDAAHCGACDHDCGGGTCSNGLCSDVVVVEGINDATDFAIDEASVWFTEVPPDPAYLRSFRKCPLTGCVGAPSFLIGESGFPSIDRLENAADQVFLVGDWDGNTQARICNENGCSGSGTRVSTASAGITSIISSPPAGGGDGDGAVYWWGAYINFSLDHADPASTASMSDVDSLISIDDNDVIVHSAAAIGDTLYLSATVEGTAGIYRCAPGECDGASDDLPVLLLAQAAAPSMAAQGNRLYWVLADGYNIYQCTLPDCATRSSYVYDATTIVGVWADGDGVYWLDYDQMLNACGLPSCIGAPAPLAGMSGDMRRVRTDADYFYWLETDGGGGTIRRVRKPAPPPL